MTTPEAEPPQTETSAETPAEALTDGPRSPGQDGAQTQPEQAHSQQTTTGAAAESSPEPSSERPDEESLAAQPGAPSADQPTDDRPEARLERAVRGAEQALIEYEIAVEIFRIEVENFSRLHHQKLGPMYARLDELDAEIAEAKAARTGDPEDVRAAHEARARVMPMPDVEELFHDWLDSDGLSDEATAMLTGQQVRPPERVRPSDEARKLYRELARKAHPDLAQDEKERTRRDEFISRVNAAYARGDDALLRELAEEWAVGPVPEGRGPSKSEELYTRLEWLAHRKDLLTIVARDLEESAIGAMLRMAPEDPDGLLDEIADQLLSQVAEREAELAAFSA